MIFGSMHTWMDESTLGEGRGGLALPRVLSKLHLHSN